MDHRGASMPSASRKSDFIPAQRRSLILEMIRQRGVVSVQELSDAISVSFATIRRDLIRMDRSGAIQRSHGGASLKTTPGTTFEPDHRITSHLSRQEKAAIGKLAAERLQDNQSVIFSSSSTVYEAAYRAVEKGLKLTAVTNDLRIAELMAGHPSISLLVSGGSLRPGSYTLLGEPGRSFLGGLHVDVALIGIHAITDSACCDTSTEMAWAQRCMASAAERVIVLADSAKFGRVAFCEAFPIQEVSEIITDDRLDPGIRRRLEAQGIKVSIATPTTPSRATSTSHRERRRKT
jgi:DeoR family transcriptional regulator, aga operon transcriptional repressor